VASAIALSPFAQTIRIRMFSLMLRWLEQTISTALARNPGRLTSRGFF
jgi:hypothetical protein